MRPLAALQTGLVALALAAPAAAASPANLRITVWPNGKQHASRAWTLRCSPVGGTLPRRRNACAVLARLRAPFAPVPKNTACSDIYGGPGVAHVRGSFRGRPVDAWFNRSNGCEIGRWDRVRVLFPVSESSSA